MYRLNSRNDDWLKVKPEYMSEFGESLDCVIIAGYYGTGKRGGALSSFLCGLRVTQNHIQAGANPEKCFSFFKVGGGFRAEDYAEIRHRTEGKWIEWDQRNPPSEYIELGGGEARQFERPDVWIRPKDSVVVSVKAASVGPSDSFALGFTLRFPRFRRLRLDRSWNTALSLEEFQELKQRVDEESKEKAMTVEDRKRHNPKRVKRELTIAGEDTKVAEFMGETTKLFEGLEFCVLSEALKPYKKTKTQLETIIKENGGVISQRAAPGTNMVLIADKKVVKVASLVKGGDVNIIRPKWIRDCLEQELGAFLLPFEDTHLFHATDALKRAASENTDQFGDSYTRDLSIEELRQVMNDMPKIEDGISFDKNEFLQQLEERGKDLGPLKSLTFRRCVMLFHAVEAGDKRISRLENLVRYGGGSVTGDANDLSVTHVVIQGDDPMQVGEAADMIRKELSSRSIQPRVVTGAWIDECWKESTLLDEEQFVVP